MATEEAISQDAPSTAPITEEKRGGRFARRGGWYGASLALVGIASFAARRVRQSNERESTSRSSVTIDRSPEEVYRFWRDLDNLPRFMANLQSVHLFDERRSHWVMKGPAGMSGTWDAEIVEDRPGDRIAWRSTSGRDPEQEDATYAVYFEAAPGDRGTEVSIELSEHPLGEAHGGLAELFRLISGRQAEEDLRRLKQILETGEVVYSDASIHQWFHSAQPPVNRYDASIGGDR